MALFGEGSEDLGACNFCPIRKRLFDKERLNRRDITHNQKEQTRYRNHSQEAQQLEGGVRLQIKVIYGENKERSLTTTAAIVVGKLVERFPQALIYAEPLPLRAHYFLGERVRIEVASTG